MLACTNDGLTGVSSMPLPAGSTPVSMDVGAYDAGSEVNDERFVSIVDSCGKVGPVMAPPDGNNDDLPEDGGVVGNHAGITGRRPDGGAPMDGSGRSHRRATHALKRWW